MVDYSPVQRTKWRLAGRGLRAEVIGVFEAIDFLLR